MPSSPAVCSFSPLAAARLLSVRARWTLGPLAFGAGGHLLKIMFSVYFARQVFVSIKAFPKREQFNSAFSLKRRHEPIDSHHA
jgi:hypothetical protein